MLIINDEDETNSKQLELYSVLGEYDNAGFPLAYCLLSTADSMELGKRKKALGAWAQQLRDRYGLIPVFIHVDKDMGEIGMATIIWPDGKIQLCWWHLRRAVRARLALAKLTTTPYDAQRAHHEFWFIDPHFRPPGRSDPKEYEGGLHDDEQSATEFQPSKPNALFIKLPAQFRSITESGSTAITGSSQPSSDANAGNKTLVIDSTAEGEKTSRRTFCPMELRAQIIDMMEAHFCAHPLLPGYSHPSPEGVKDWAVREMYDFCVKHDLREAWAYLWENWYRRGRWELWARAAFPEVPRLKTTMMVESQYVVLFSDLLTIQTHFLK